MNLKKNFRFETRRDSCEQASRGLATKKGSWFVSTSGPWCLGGLLLAAALLSGCAEEPQGVFQGYAEGEYVLVAAPIGARLETLPVRRGDQVEVGDLLFVLDPVAEQAALAAAEQDVARGESRLADLRKGQRPSELRAIRARVEQAQVAVELAEREYVRRKELVKSRDVAVEEYERSEAALQRDQATLADLKAQLETAQLGARSDLVAAAEAERDAARARLKQARWALEQMSPRASVAAQVFDTLFEPGEFVRAGYPVVSLLPPGNIKIRFFVPEMLAGSFTVGERVAVSFDGSAGSLPATIVYISPQAEYTPPVIYSREARTKLVFMLEARPDPDVAALLHPGQPVDVQRETPRD